MRRSFPMLKIFPIAFLFATASLFAQDPLRLLPHNYRSIFENEVVRVIDVHYGPHEKLVSHNHSDKPTVYVYLNDSGPVKFSHIEEHEFTLTRPAEKAGTFRVSPGRLEKHEVENLGAMPSNFLRVELKQLPLGFQQAAFRSPKSFDLSRSGPSTEFACPAFQVQRIVSAHGEPAAVPADGAASLLVAFSATSIDSGGSTEALTSGQVLWLPAGARAGIQYQETASPRYVLRIAFPQKGR